MQKTTMINAEKVERKWYLIDAKDKILGRVAVKAANLLRGKTKPTYTPHVDTGDNVIIINAGKIRVSANKMEDKIYHRYTGYSSGHFIMKMSDLMKKDPTEPMELAVKRMIPRNTLGFSIFRKLKIYADDKHPHIAQKPITVKI